MKNKNSNVAVSEKNSTLIIKKVEKNGETFYNLVLDIVLDNGETVSMEVKPKFYNHKFMYKLRCHLPIK